MHIKYVYTDKIYLLGLFCNPVLGCCSSLDLHEALGQHGRLLVLEHDHQIKDGTKSSQDRLQGGGETVLYVTAD